MKHSSKQKILSLFNEQIRKAEFRIAFLKKQLDELEAKRLPTSHACRELAMAAKHLYIRKVRRAALLKASCTLNQI